MKINEMITVLWEKEGKEQRWQNVLSLQPADQTDYLAFMTTNVPSCSCCRSCGFARRVIGNRKVFVCCLLDVLCLMASPFYLPTPYTSTPPPPRHSAGGVMLSRLPSQVRLSVGGGSEAPTHRPPSSRLPRGVRLPASF